MNPDARLAVRLAFLVAYVASTLPGCSFPWQSSATDAQPPATTAPLIKGVDHILFTVSDLDRSVKFYRDVLGLTVAHKSRHFVWLKAGEFGIALSDKAWGFEKKGEPKGVGMIPHFAVREMDALAARLKEHHIPWLREPKDEGWGIEAFVTDPDGYQWGVRRAVSPWPLVGLAAESPCGVLNLLLCAFDHSPSPPRSSWTASPNLLARDWLAEDLAVKTVDFPGLRALLHGR